MAGRREHGMHPRDVSSRETRRSVAVEAARLISESGLRDYGRAKAKAAAQLGVFDEGLLPKNSEIEEALREHQRLFHGDDQVRTLRRLRDVALEAMRFFARHEPRLVGAVLEGTADEHSAVCLHLYTDQPQDVVVQLLGSGIPYEEQSRRLRLDRETSRDFPVLLISAEGTAVDLTLLPYDLLRQAPLDRISEKPMHRASTTMLQQLLRD